MLRTIYGDPDRYVQHYWSQIAGVYFTGDGARRDEDGYFWIMGRIDDVVNVSGHRLGTMEVESALVSHPAVAEAAVVGRPDDIKGQAIAAFVTPRGGPHLERRAREGAARARRQGDRRLRPPRRPPLHRRPAQDPQRQDHAPPAARHRRRARRRSATRRRWKTCRCSPSCARTRNDERQKAKDKSQKAKGRSPTGSASRLSFVFCLLPFAFPGNHAHMTLRVHNTLTGKVEDFAPLHPPQGRHVRLRRHRLRPLAHRPCARAGDLRRHLIATCASLGYDVTFVRNFTDVDDKIIKRGHERGLTAQRSRRRRTSRRSREDMLVLGCAAPTGGADAPPSTSPR